MKKLTILSFGAGQDSTALFIKAAFDVSFRNQFEIEDFAVVMSDTGNEHDETYAHLVVMMKLAKKLNIPFFLLSGDLDRTSRDLNMSPLEAIDLGVVTGYHTEAWKGLEENWARLSNVGSVAYPKTCTGNLKIDPIYRFLEQYVGDRYDLPKARKGASGRWSPKKAIPTFAEKYGKIQVMIGIARGEENRVDTGENARTKWMPAAIEKIYPLIDLGLDRQGCQDYIASMEETTGIPVPPPSNCIFCPFLSPIELLWVSRRYPKRFEDWVGYEAKKLEANADLGEKNYGVYGKGWTLRSKLVSAEKEFGHMSDAQLDEHKMSHGHCVQSKY